MLENRAWRGHRPGSGGPRGLPASGESTLACQLAPGIPAIRLEKDGWATQLGADLWDEEF